MTAYTLKTTRVTWTARATHDGMSFSSAPEGALLNQSASRAYAVVKVNIMP